MNVQTVNIPLSKIEVNKGQIKGVPANPRQIKDDKYKALVKSIKDDPEMLALRELLVFEHEGAFVLIGGNMRYRALKELKYKEAPCKIIPADTSVEKLKAYLIKDNNGFGEWDWDMLANDWDSEELRDWGVDVPATKAEKMTEILSGLEYKPLFYEPTHILNLKLRDCVDLDKFNAKIEALNEYNLSDEEKEVLRLFAYRFIKIDFESVANFYSFNASEEMQKAMERLRLVLVDEENVGGMIEDDLLRIANMSINAVNDDEEDDD